MKRQKEIKSMRIKLTGSKNSSQKNLLGKDWTLGKLKGLLPTATLFQLEVRKKNRQFAESQRMKSILLEVEKANLTDPEKDDLTDKKAPFLKAFAKYRVASKACASVAVNAGTVNYWRKNDPIFENAYNYINTIIIEDLESAGYERAIEGSDNLLMFFLRALKPNIYKDLKTIETIQPTLDTKQIFKDLSTEQLQEMVNKLASGNNQSVS